MMATRPFPVTTVILAGGQGKRIGGNKGLQQLQGKPLITWILHRVAEDSREVIINVNGEQTPYLHFRCRLIADQMQGWQGPLAGMRAAMQSAQNEYVMCVPCDTPFLPTDLIARLYAELKCSGNEAAVAVVGGYRQPAIVLFDSVVLHKLTAFLTTEKRKVNDWLDTLRLSEVVFDNGEAFDNINTPEDLARAERRVAAQSAGNIT